MTDIKMKRKRSANTSNEQYEEYLTLMENDYVFRSGIVNPTLGDDYVKKKWEELCTRLNSLGNGPALPIEIWKKRFNDWKNATRSKYRKIRDNRYKTGGGPETTITLTPIEERGINVWGKVTVTGACNVSVTGGLVETSMVIMDTPVDFDVNITEEQLASTSLQEEIITPMEQQHLPETSNESQLTNPTIFGKKAPQKPKNKFQKQNKPLNEITKSLLNVYTDNVNVNKELITSIKRFGDLYEESEKKKLELNTRKLEFDIATYKFKNKDFEFN